MTILLMILGIALLIAGAELLVRGASRMAAAWGISPLVIGLTVVAFGTSAPEMAVSVMSSLSGNADIALGNVLGSNIFNILFILGLSAVITPLTVSRQLLRLDVPVMIAASFLVPLLGYNGYIGRLEGLLLVVGVTLYTICLIRLSRRESREARSEAAESGTDEPPAPPGHWAVNLVLVVAGLVMLVLGSRWLVEGAVVIAKWMGLSELIIGLTIIAAGTSLPEVAASVVAALRGQRDIAVGNVVGSNIFNILAVLGLSALVVPGGLPVKPEAMRIDIPVMIATAVACLPIFFTGRSIDRWEGAIFLGSYVAYTAYLVLASAHHEALGSFQLVLFAVAIPLTLITLGISLWRSLKNNRKMAR